jgi:mycothiol synthase
MEFTIEHRPDATTVVHLDPAPGDGPTELLDALRLAANAGPLGDTWLHGSTDELDAVLAAEGFSTNRSLPADPSQLLTRAFTDADTDEFIRVNNRAFSWHPEQSGMTAESFAVDRAAEWFDPQGFRLHEIDGRLAGFCWTKVHTEPEALGEIYVIALDPDFFGRGLGVPMTLAGLEHLSALGLTTGMLYVESDNAAAVATYERIGFSIHRVDKLWRTS